MRITIFVHALSGGGAEHVAALWARGFVCQGHQVSVVVYSGNRVDYQIPKEVELYEVRIPKGNRIRRYIGKICNLRKAFKELHPDLIITVMHPCSFYALLATIGMNIPIVNTEHNAFERPQGARWSKLELFQKFYLNRLFKYVTVLTQTDKDFIGSRLKNVVVVPNPLAFSPLPEIPPKQNIVLAMGRLDGWYVKGFDVLIKAWGIVCKKHPDWNLHIAGEGGEQAQKHLKAICEECNAQDNVSLVGFYTNPTEAYQPASIFVLSSRCDGFGMVLVEAMSQGCACVACDYKGRQREIIRNNKEGIICEPEDADGLADAIVELIENHEMRKDIQNHSLVRSRQFELDSIMKKWDLIISNL